MKDIIRSFLYSTIFLFLAASITQAQFYKPSDDQVFDLGYGQSDINVQVEWDTPPCSNPYYKLSAPPLGTYESSSYYGIEHYYDLSGGEYTWRIEIWGYVPGLGQVKVENDYVTFYVQPSIKVENEFGGGTVYVNSVSKASGYSFTPDPGEYTSLEAIDQYYNPYQRYFAKWSTPNGDFSSRTISAPAPTSSHALYTVDFNNEYNITFQNNFTGVGNGGVIKVGSTQYDSPSSGHTVVEPNSISGTAINQTVNGIYYTFYQWSTSSSSMTTTFYPSGNNTYTAYYTGKPVFSNRGLTSNSTPEEYVTLYWNEHPNSNVYYKIYRKVKTNGVMGSEVYLGSVSHGTTTYIDYEWTIADGSTTNLLHYDVRPYYTTESSEGDPNYQALVYGECDANIANNDSETAKTELAAEEATIKEISLGNFPNPFNPTTNISYSLANDGFVSLKVFDVLGKEVASLVNEVKSAGQYSVSFNGTDLPSGVYIYTLQTNGHVITRKMLLMK
ncbi:MAG: hypothetical protein A2V66_16185 [Ignavibacteria bacterium RBG_13_36_8]|nr:MAG: hypothetical protein A2V66_16185 [Ignavibacteria bacterium RBG_13_36_8]